MQIRSTNMKTNTLFVCDYCGKTLSCEKSVRCHISLKHKADPENPLMFHDILVSPTKVDSLLGKIKGKKVPRKIAAETENRAGQAVTEHTAGLAVIEHTAGLTVTEHTAGLAVSEHTAGIAVTEHTAGLAVTEHTAGLAVTEHTAGLAVTEHTAGQQVVTGIRDIQDQEVTELKDRQGVTEPKSRQEVTVTGQHVGTKETHKNKVGKKKFSSYNYRKLANQFSLPAPREDPLPPPQPSNLLDIDIQVEESPSITQSEKLPKRRQFQVPFKRKPPRGKCSNWLSCVNCSRDTDCEECKFCLNPNLK